jgi:hypothetical protein
VGDVAASTPINVSLNPLPNGIWTNIAGSDATLVTTGRPVIVFMAFGAPSGNFELSTHNLPVNQSAPTARLAIARNGKAIAGGVLYEGMGAFSWPTSLQALDLPPPGTNVYSLQVLGLNENTSIYMEKCVLVAYEL